MKHSFMGNLTRIMAALLFIGSAHAASDTTFDNALMPHIIMHYVLKCQAQEAPLSEALQRYCNELQTGEIQTTTEDHALIAHELLTHFDTVRTYLQNLYRTWLAVGEIPEHYRALTRAVNCDTASVLGLIGNISILLVGCCTGYDTDFVGTWTALATLETDITTCCSTQQANFVSTWTIINSLPSTNSVCGPVTVIRQSDIDAGNYTISTPGNYCLGEDIVYNGNNTAITINSSNVFLDMQNHEILGNNNTTGIQVNDSVNDIVITNGTFSDGFLGVALNPGGPNGNNNITIESCLFQNQQGTGIDAKDGSNYSNHTIAYCVFLNEAPITYSIANNFSVHDCTICNSLGYAIAIGSGSTIIIENCIVDLINIGNFNTAINLVSHENISIHNCLIRNGSLSIEGISLTDCTSANVSSCLFSSCNNGISVDTSSTITANATVTECYAFDNSVGIATGAPGIVIDTCIVSRNSNHGIQINMGATNNIVQNCVTSNNAVIGIYLLHNPSQTTLTNNIIINNPNQGINSSALNAVIENNISMNASIITQSSVMNPINNFIRNNEACNSTGFGDGGTNDLFYNNNAFNCTLNQGYSGISNYFNVNTPDVLQGLVSDILSNITNT